MTLGTVVVYEISLSFLGSTEAGCSNDALAGARRVRESPGSAGGVDPGRQVLRVVRLQFPTSKAIERTVLLRMSPDNTHRKSRRGGKVHVQTGPLISVSGRQRFCLLPQLLWITGAYGRRSRAFRSCPELRC